LGPAVAATVVTAAILILPARASAQIRFRGGATVNVNFTADAGLQSFALGDVNKDGAPDIVAVSANDDGNDAIAVALNRGDGNFDAPQFLEDPEGDLFTPSPVTVGDVGGPNGVGPDGNPDIIVANFDGIVIVAFGDGAGGFQLAGADERLDLSGEIQGDLVGIVAGDFNNQNRKDDVAVLDNGGFVFFLCNTGSGTFDLCPTPSLATGGQDPITIGIGDMNGDGSPDIAALNQQGSTGGNGSVALFLGAGDGTFSPSSPAVVNVGKSDATDLAVGPIDGDNLDDVVVVFIETLGGDSVQVFLGATNGRLRAQSVVTGVSFSPLAVAIADFDADGSNDLVSPQRDDSFPGVVQGDGSGGFELITLTQSASTGKGRAVAVADLNKDGKPDFVVLRNDDDQLRADINNSGPAGTATFTPTGPTATRTPTRTKTPTATATPVPTVPFGGCSIDVGGEPVAVASGLLNQDLTPDLAAVDAERNQLLLVLINPATIGDPQCPSNFDIKKTDLAGKPTAVTVGKVDSDQLPDVVVAGVNGVTVFLSDGKGGFRGDPIHLDLPSGSTPRSVVIADVNSDGHWDLVTANGGSTVSIFPGKGDGTFENPVVQEIFRPATFVAVATLNDDVRPDLAVGSDETTATEVTVLLQELVPLTFRALDPFRLDDGAPTSMIEEDFNLDGIPDLGLTVARSGSGSFVVLQGVRPAAGSFTLSRGSTFSGTSEFPLDPLALATGDFAFNGIRGDGKPDVVIANKADLGNLYFLAGVGNGSFDFRQPFVINATPVSVSVADFDGDGKLDVVSADVGGTLALLRSSRPPPTPTPTITPIPTETGTPTPTGSITPTPPTATSTPGPAPTRQPTATPKAGTFQLSGGGCAIVDRERDGLSLLPVLVAIGLILQVRRFRRGGDR